MCLLSCVVKLASKELFEEHALNWYKTTLRVASSTPTETLLSLCYETLLCIMQRAQTVDRISREIATKGMDNIISIILGKSLFKWLLCLCN